MKNKYTKCIFALFMLAFFVACSENLFGSSSAQGGNCDNKNLDCLQIEAEELFRAGKYSQSYKTYEKIVNIDSNSYADPKRSVGYFGMAKAGLWMDSVTVFNFLGLSKDTENLNGSDPAEVAKFFQREVDVKSQNRYLQGSKKADKALRELSRRDSLTEVYYNFLDGKTDSIAMAFAETYCSNKLCKDPKNKDESFPLSDMKYRKKSFSIGYAVSALLKTVLGSIVFDNFGNGCIFDKKPPDPKAYGCTREPLIDIEDVDMNSLITFDEDGMIQVDLEELYEKLLENEDLVDVLNERFEGLVDDIGELSDIIGSITSDSANTQDSLQKQLAEFKDYALFVRLNDEIDNDGDGCINEELSVNGKIYDTDGDGFNGEDLRIIPILPNAWDCTSSENQKVCVFHPPPAKNFIQNDYFIMDIFIYGNGVADTIVRGAWSLEPDFWADEFVYLPDNMARSEFKKGIQVEKDKDGKTRCWPLEERQRRLGGCWNNYSAQDFINYRNNPLQIEKGGMNPECKGIY